jgi:flagellar motor switch protein FliM
VAGPAEIDGTAADITRGEQSLAAMGQVAPDSPREHPDGLYPDEEMLGSTRLLDQDEIDSLLGFDEGTERNGDGSGIQAIVNSALVSYERLPMLEVVFDRLVRLMSTSMRNFTSDNVEVSLESVASVRFGDYLNGVPLPGMLNVFKADEWDNYGLITI